QIYRYINMRKGAIRGILFLMFAFLSSGFLTGFINDNTNHNDKKAEVSQNARFEGYIDNIYNKAGLYEAGLSKATFEKAVVGYYNIKETKGSKFKVPILSVIDFTKSS